MDTYIPAADFNLEIPQGGMKAAMQESGAKSRDLLMVPIDNLKVVADMNVRIKDEEYEAHIEEIKESIIENGFFQHCPISGYAGKEGDQTFIFVTGGFTRLEAAKRAVKAGAPIEALPVVLKPSGTSMADIMFGLDMDNTGSPLRPYERATVVKRLVGYGVEEDVIAKRMGKSSQYIKDMLYGMSLPTSLRGQIISGKASFGHVVSLARKLGPAEALKAFESATPPAGGTASPDAGTTTAARVTPRNTAGAAGKKVIAKKTLFNAIDYAIALPGDGITWLASWRKGEADAVKELESYKPPRKQRKDAKPKADKPKGKPGRPKKNKGAAAAPAAPAAAAAENDPL